MKNIEKFSDFVDIIISDHSRKRVAVVCPYDDSTQSAVARCLEIGTMSFDLFCSSERISELPAEWFENPNVRIIEAETDKDAAYAAVAVAKSGGADVLMKGLVSTDTLLKAILDKETGILPKGNVLTHLAVAELPSYKKLLFFSDVAVIPYPDIEQRRQILRYDLDTCRKFGIGKPKVAFIHFTEKVNPKFSNTTDYVALINEAKEGKFGDVSMGGPMDVKSACDAHSAEVKGIADDVCGDADLLLFQNIDAANTFYKTITVFGGACIAGMLQGTEIPVVLPSRSDSDDSKFYSIAMACISGR